MRVREKERESDRKRERERVSSHFIQFRKSEREGVGGIERKGHVTSKTAHRIAERWHGIDGNVEELPNKCGISICPYITYMYVI